MWERRRNRLGTQYVFGCQHQIVVFIDQPYYGLWTIIDSFNLFTGINNFTLEKYFTSIRRFLF